MWIESHQSLRSHPKIKKAARLAGINEFEMIGRLHCLWWWALDYAPDGDISKYSADDIEDAVDWSGQRGVLYKSLFDCGFNGHRGLIEKFDDGSIHIHDWMEYGGKLLEQREFNSERARRKRELYDDMRLTRAVKSRDKNTCRYCGIEVDWTDRKGKNGGTYDHVDPEGQNTEDNIVVSCRSCNSKKNRRTPEQAGMELITVDNLPEIRLKSGNNLLLQNRTEQTEQTEDNKPQEIADKPRQPLSETQQRVLSAFNAKRFKNDIQRDAVLKWSDYPPETVNEAITWAATKGFALGQAIENISRALPKWNAPKPNGNGNGRKPAEYTNQMLEVIKQAQQRPDYGN